MVTAQPSRWADDFLRLSAHWAEIISFTPDRHPPQSGPWFAGRMRRLVQDHLINLPAQDIVLGLERLTIQREQLLPLRPVGRLLSHLLCAPDSPFVRREFDSGERHLAARAAFDWAGAIWPNTGLDHVDDFVSENWFNNPHHLPIAAEQTPEDREQWRWTDDLSYKPETEAESGTSEELAMA